jgi:hypothetical protein
MDSLVSQIRELASKADADSRKEILGTLEGLLTELQDPVDILFGAYGSVCLSVSYILLLLEDNINAIL